MALGDLVTEFYTFEYNGLAIGAGTDYDLLEVRNLLGYLARSDSTDRFGRHGATAGRHYANMKEPQFEGQFKVASDTDFQTKRQALAAAFGIRVAPINSLDLVTMLPGPTSLKISGKMRPRGLEVPMNRQHALKYAPFLIRMEMVDPILYALVSSTQIFTVPTDTRVLTNDGNAPAVWTATLVGPAENPILTNNDTGQILSFSSLTLTTGETLTYDSSDSSVKVNGVSVSSTFSTGFQWWDLDPGANSISFAATQAGSSSFSITWRDAYWSN